MTELDFVLLTVYFLCVTYVLYQIVNSFNDEVTIWLDEANLKQQLTEQGIQDLVDIKFKFLNRYEFRDLKKLQIRITNKSTNAALHVDWDYCTLSDQYDPRRSRRVTRQVPGSTLDAFQRQVFSSIAPGNTLYEDIIGEDMLTRKGENNKLEVDPDKSLLDFSKPPKIAPASRKALHKKFMNGEALFEFDLLLLLRFIGYGASRTTDPTGDRLHQVVCRLKVRHLDWTAGLPWNPKLP